SLPRPDCSDCGRGGAAWRVCDTQPSAPCRSPCAPPAKSRNSPSSSLRSPSTHFPSSLASRSGARPGSISVSNLLRVGGNLHQRGAQELVTQLVAAADLLDHLVVRHILTLFAAERLMHARVELCADCFHRLHIQPAQRLFHLLQDELDPGAKLFNGPLSLERQREVVHHAEERVDRGLHGIVACILAFLHLALAGVVELRLQARQPILQCIALLAQSSHFRSLLIRLLTLLSGGLTLLSADSLLRLFRPLNLFCPCHTSVLSKSSRPRPSRANVAHRQSS